MNPLLEQLHPNDPSFWVKIVTTLICGGIIGLERQIRGKPAGIRTSILICLGTQMFMTMGLALTFGQTDHTRVVAQVITGIGFLGAGVIMSREGLVTGVTSAAVIWVLSAIGIAIGMNLIPAAIALTIVTVAVLTGVEILENSFIRLRQGAHSRPHGNGRPEQPEG